MSSSSSWSKFVDLQSMFRKREVKKILILFLVLTVSCLFVYKRVYHPSLSLLDYISSSSSQPKSKSLIEILEKASTKNKTVIITTLNEAWAEPKSIFDLFLESFHIGQGTEKLLKHVIVICFDIKAFERCSKIHPNCYYLETTGIDLSGEKRYNTPDYVAMMWKRIELLIKILEMGFNFIFTDTDVMWLRDPFPRLYPDGDFQMACDRFFGNPLSFDNWANGGFLYVKSNKRSIEFYKFWYNSRLKHRNLHDQDVFNRIKHDPEILEIGVQIRFFNTTYIGGFCELSKDINLVCTVHGNCCLGGVENKIHDLNFVLNDWRKYLSSKEQVKNTTWSVPNKCHV